MFFLLKKIPPWWEIFLPCFISFYWASFVTPKPRFIRTSGFIGVTTLLLSAARSVAYKNLEEAETRICNNQQIISTHFYPKQKNMFF